MYAIQPGRRFALDLDGTVGLVQYSGGAMQQLSAKAMRNLQSNNNWLVSTVSTGTPVPEDPSRFTPTKLWLLFPELRDLYAIYMSYGWRQNYAGNFYWGTYSSGYVYSSIDTTTGIDGTWDAVGEFVGSNGYSFNDMTYGASSENVLYGNVLNTSTLPYGRAVDNYRRYAVPLVGSVSSVRGLRIDLANRGYGYQATDVSNSNADQDYFIQNLHLYGEYSSGALSDSLVFWHPTLDVPLEMADLDMRDAALGTSTRKQFRVKNVSASLTAQNVTVSRFIDVDTVPSLLTQYSLSADSLTWTDPVSVGTLAPGAISGTLWVSRVTPMNAQMSANMIGIKAAVGSWA